MALGPFVGQDLGDSRFAECLKGLFLTVVNIKNGEQFRDLQQVSYLPSQVGQLDAGASMSRRRIDFHQRSQPHGLLGARVCSTVYNPLSLKNQVEPVSAVDRLLRAANGVYP